MAIEFEKPSDLPPATSLSDDSSLVVQTGLAVEKATPRQIVDKGRPVASESQAVAGRSNEVAMTPLSTQQALGAFDFPGAAASRSVNGIHYKRSLQVQVPFTTEWIRADPSGIGYPQAFAVDALGNRLFIWQSGGAGGFVTVRDLDSGALIREFKVEAQLTRETLLYENVGGVETLTGFRLTDVWRLDITTLPDNQTTVTPTVITPEVQTLSQGTVVNGGYAYQQASPLNPGGRSVKHRYVISDRDFNKVGEVEFPIGVCGSFIANDQGGYLDQLPKIQSTTYHNGKFVFGAGGIYNSTKVDPDPEASTTLISRKQGIIICNEFGDVEDVALCHPDVALQKTGELIGETILVHECEGVYSTSTQVASGGKLYALWQTLTGAQITGPEALERGIVITIEGSLASDAVDYSEGAATQYNPYDQRQTAKYVVSGNQILDPILGTPLNSFAEIIRMMTGLAMQSYSFHGFGQTLTDVNGDPVSVAGCSVTFELYNNVAAFVHVRGQDRNQVYQIGGVSTGTLTQNLAKQFVDNGGRLIVGIEDENPAANQVVGANLSPVGQFSIYATGGTPLKGGRGDDGYLLEARRAGSLSGGLFVDASGTRFKPSETADWETYSGNPEGNLARGVGSFVVRSDNGKVYAKITGTGVTGWSQLLISKAAPGADAEGFVPIYPSKASAIAENPLAPAYDVIHVTETSDVVTYVRKALATDLIGDDGSRWERRSITQADLSGMITDILDAITLVPWSPNNEYVPTLSFATPGDSVVTYGATRAGLYEKTGYQTFLSAAFDPLTITHTTASGRIRLNLPETVATGAVGSIPVTIKPAALVLPRGAFNLRFVPVPGQMYAELAFDTHRRLLQYPAYNLVTPFRIGELITGATSGMVMRIHDIKFGAIAGTPAIDQYLIVQVVSGTLTPNETFNGNGGGQGSVGATFTTVTSGGTTYCDQTHWLTGVTTALSASTSGLRV